MGNQETSTKALNPSTLGSPRSRTRRIGLSILPRSGRGRASRSPSQTTQHLRRILIHSRRRRRRRRLRRRPDVSSPPGLAAPHPPLPGAPNWPTAFYVGCNTSFRFSQSKDCRALANTAPQSFLECRDPELNRHDAKRPSGDLLFAAQKKIEQSHGNASLPETLLYNLI